MDQQPQKRLSVGDDGPQTKRIKTSGPETPAVYSDAVRRKLQSASRTGQACDRCKERKMRCDANPSGCAACQQKNLRCVTTDRITGRPFERGQSDRLEVENMTLRKQLEVYTQKYGPLAPPDVEAADAYHERVSLSSVAQHIHESEPYPSEQAEPPSEPGPHRGPVRGTKIDILDGEMDVADFKCPETVEGDLYSENVLTHSRSSFIRTATQIRTVPKPTLPPKSDVLRSLEAFLKFLMPYTPIVHGPSLLDLAVKFFDPEFKASIPQTAIIFSTLAVINFQMALRNTSQSREKLKESSEQYHYTLSLLPQLWFDSSLESMQAQAQLLCLVRMLPKPGHSWEQSSMLLHRLIDFDYHRSATKITLPESQHNPLAIEMRKRVFWTVVSINVMTCLKLGKPMPFRAEDVDVEFPAVLEESEISEAGIAQDRTGRCTIRSAIYIARLQPLLIELYNQIISVRSPAAVYRKRVEELRKKIAEWRQDWTRQSAVDQQDGFLTLATLHLDTWGAEFELMLHHPQLCTAPEEMEKNLGVCLSAALRMMNNARLVFGKYKAVDFTWNAMVSYCLAFGITLDIYRRPKTRIGREKLDSVRKELDDWLKIMMIADKVLKTDGLYHRTFKPLVETVMSEVQSTALAAPALQNGFRQESDESSQRRSFDHDISPTQYSQHSDQGPTYQYPGNVSGTSQQPPPYPDTPHPPMFPDPFQLSAAATQSQPQPPQQQVQTQPQQSYLAAHPAQSSYQASTTHSSTNSASPIYVRSPSVIVKHSQQAQPPHPVDPQTYPIQTSSPAEAAGYTPQFQQQTSRSQSLVDFSQHQQAESQAQLQAQHASNLLPLGTMGPNWDEQALWPQVIGNVEILYWQTANHGGGSAGLGGQ